MVSPLRTVDDEIAAWMFGKSSPVPVEFTTQVAATAG
jgi:hypothetical protein